MLIWARRTGLLADLSQHLDALRAGGFRIGQGVFDQALRAVGEFSP
ncbi:MAG: DUF3368 domain-containing protein [Armatimonadetes bacterium]|nr:DUF3368 domain-containing protein [Armatimonadota bacterium]